MCRQHLGQQDGAEAEAEDLSDAASFEWPKVTEIWL